MIAITSVLKNTSKQSNLQLEQSTLQVVFLLTHFATPALQELIGCETAAIAIQVVLVGLRLVEFFAQNVLASYLNIFHTSSS